MKACWIFSKLVLNFRRLKNIMLCAKQSSRDRHSGNGTHLKVLCVGVLDTEKWCLK